MSMATSRLISLSFSIFIQLFALIAAKPNYQVCYNTGNFTNNSTYQSNLNHVLSSFTSAIQDNHGFYSFSSGQNPNKVHAIGLCRGDVRPETCRGCLSNSTQDIRNVCPNQKEAIVWYDSCMLRYSNRSMYGIMEFRPYFYMYNVNNVSNPSEFNQAVKSILGKLTSVAASGDHRLKFATGNTTTTNSGAIFALAQCTPDLSMGECRDCFTNITSILPECCDGRQGGRVIGPSCNFRYETNRFYDVIDADAPSPSRAPSSTPVPSPSPVPSSPSPFPSPRPPVPSAPSPVPSPTSPVPPPPSPVPSPTSPVPPPPSPVPSAPSPTNAATTEGKGRSVFMGVITLVSLLCLL